MIMPSLLGLASLACGSGAAGIATRWCTRRRDSLGRPRPFPLWSVCLLVVLTVLAAVPGARRAEQEHTLASVASQLAGRSVAVHCQSTAAALVDAGAELGFVPYGDDGVPLPRTTLKREPCAALRSYREGSKQRPSRDEVIAVHVLTHEAMHMRGETAEAVAECEAVQRDARTARLLGATPAQAQQLARTYWLTIYPHVADDYRSDDCRPGGGLDERIASASWG